jgi:hypothetical protein
MGCAGSSPASKYQIAQLEADAQQRLSSEASAPTTYEMSVGPIKNGIYSSVVFKDVSSGATIDWTPNAAAKRFIIDSQKTNVGIHAFNSKGTEQADGRTLRTFMKSGDYIGVLSTPAGVALHGPTKTWKGGEGNTIIYCRLHSDMKNNVAILHFIDSSTNFTVMKRTAAGGQSMTCTIMPWAQDTAILMLGLMMSSMEADGIYLTPARV